MIIRNASATRPPVEPGDVYIYAHGSGAISVEHGDGSAFPSVTLAAAQETVRRTTGGGSVVWVGGDDAPLAVDVLSALGGPGIHLEPFVPSAPPFVWENGLSPLMCAVTDGDHVLLADLIERGGDVHHRDPLGFTALHYAAAAGYRDGLLALIAAGADVDAASFNGDRPWDQAQLWGHSKLAASLVLAGALGLPNTGPYSAGC